MGMTRLCDDCGATIGNGRMRRCPDCRDKHRKKYNAACERKRYDKQHPDGRYRRIKNRERRESPYLQVRPGIASSVEHENAVLEEDFDGGYDSVNKIDRNEYDILDKKDWKNWKELGDYKKLCKEPGEKDDLVQKKVYINDKKIWRLKK